MEKCIRRAVIRKLVIGIDTPRYYELLGLIEKPERDENRYRIYSETDTAKIDHIL